MARVIVLGGLAESLVNFRGDLLREMIANGHEVIACAPNASKKTRDELSSMGVSYRHAEIDRTGVNPIKDARSIMQLITLMRSVKADVFLGYTIKAVIYGSIAARITGVSRTFSMIEGLGYAFSEATIKQRVLGKIASTLYRVALGTNKGVFFLNPDDQALFRKLRIIANDKQSILLNGIGVDLEKYNFSPITNKHTFLLVTRLIREKGVYEYVEAARIVKRKHPHTRFLLVGWIDDSPAAISDSELRQWVREETIEYLGKLDDVKPAIRDSSIYVLPSFYREGLPRTILEAMAMGRPIITTNAPGCRETVSEGKNGFLIPVRNVDKLVESMLVFIEHPELIEKMGHFSRKIAEEKYDVHKVNATILKAMGLL